MIMVPQLISFETCGQEEGLPLSTSVQTLSNLFGSLFEGFLNTIIEFPLLVEAKTSRGHHPTRKTIALDKISAS
jgi:hypothetical protein